MIELFIKGGFFMWPLLILGFIIVILTINKGIALFIRKESDIVKHEIGINSILFWGIVSLAFAIFAHHYGVVMAMNATASAHDITPAIVAKGYFVSLITMVFGLIIVLVSALCWFLLRWQYRKLTSS